MDEGHGINFAKPHPVFPLGSIVAMPGAVTPLHIFEDRYRAMVADVLDGDGVIAMAAFADPPEVWQPQYQDRPRLRPCVCVGSIIRHERLSDGRYNILLHGVARATVVSEHEGRPYRLATLRALEETHQLDIDLEEHRRRFERLLERAQAAQTPGCEAVRNWINGEIPTSTLIDLAALCIAEDGVKYQVLAEPDAARRAVLLCRHLESRQGLGSPTHPCDEADPFGDSSAPWSNN